MESNINELRNANNMPNHENSILVQRETYKGSQWTMIQYGDKHFLTIGKFRLTKEFDTKEELIEHIEENTIDLLTTTMIAMYQTFKENEGLIEEIILQQ